MIKWIVSSALFLVLLIGNYLIDLQEGIKPIIFSAIFALFMFNLLFWLLPKDKDYNKNLILASGVLITIISWFIVGYLDNENEKMRNKLEFERSTKQSKRDLKIKFLMDAYFRLTNSDMRDTTPFGIQKNMYDYIYFKYSESALTSIQLLGSEKTIKIANDFILSGGNEHLSDLLESLRDDLRKELELDSLPKTKDYHPTVFRAYKKLDAPNELTPDQQFQLILKLNEYDRELLK
jgi:hypothetical protein